jgi:hypothetical protein
MPPFQEEILKRDGGIFPSFAFQKQLWKDFN